MILIIVLVLVAYARMLRNYVDGFFMDTTDVTNAQFAVFVQRSWRVQTPAATEHVTLKKHGSIGLRSDTEMTEMLKCT